MAPNDSRQLSTTTNTRFCWLPTTPTDFQRLPPRELTPQPNSKALAALEDAHADLPHASAAVEASLLKAIKYGDVVQVNAALMLGASPNAVDAERDFTALMVRPEVINTC